MPEPTLFGSPPAGSAPDVQLAFYSNYMGMLAGAAGSAVAFARCRRKGVVSGVLAGFGLASVAGASFLGQHLYNNFLYKESARAATETRLFLMAIAAGLLGVAVALIPGYRSRLGKWQNIAVPAMGAAGCGLAALAHLPALANAPGKVIAVLGGLLFTGTGVISFMERNGRGENPQQRIAMPLSMALLFAGLMTTVGATLALIPESLGKGALALAIAEAVFAVFMTMAFLSIIDFAVPPKVKTKMPSPSFGGDNVPPPPGMVQMPHAPGMPRAPIPPPPGGAYPAPVSVPQAPMTAPAPSPAPARAPSPAPAQSPAPARAPAQSPAPARAPAPAPAKSPSPAPAQSPSPARAPAPAPRPGVQRPPSR